ncbi:MAG: hypothetical protein HC769_12040 [Cyanobacteria bacterium CRU_2_1]|nr:hypothetical protein [Cyanobacteria bacterium CRU_2_1]
MTVAGTAIAHEVGLSANIQVRTSNGETSTHSAENLPDNVQVTSIEIVAIYSTGEPMSGAQISVYSPGDRSTPWRTGTLDAQGRYTFTPDLAQRGRWTVTVQSSGHSNFIDILI